MSWKWLGDELQAFKFAVRGACISDVWSMKILNLVPSLCRYLHVESLPISSGQSQINFLPWVYTEEKKEPSMVEARIFMLFYMVEWHHLVKLFTWFIKSSGHEGYKDLVLPDECPNPIAYIVKAVNKEDLSRCLCKYIYDTVARHSVLMDLRC